MAANQYDFAIIGSGVSGGRVAYELTRGGAKCVLLEAGKRFEARDFPKPEIDYSSQLFWGGGIEFNHDGRLGLLRAKCVGGTSIVNQALLDEFDDLAWEDWIARSGARFLNAAEMKPHYDAILAEVPVSEVPPAYFNRNTKIFVEGFERKSLRWSPLHRAQKDCRLDQGTDCICCLGGCPRESKQSSAVTTIRWAEKNGMRVEPDFEVMELDATKDGVRVIGRQAGSPIEVRAGKAVLAAGSLGNTAILFRSGFGSRLPALGTRFACHPQFMTYGLFSDHVDAHKGAFQAVKSDDPKLRRMGVKFENVFAPPIATAMLFSGMGRRHFEKMRKYRHYASIEVAVRDEPSGVIRLDKNGKLAIRKSLTAQDRRRAREGLDVVREILLAAGALAIEPCAQGFGLHLMGGCPIGTDAKESVVNPDFQLHGLPNVYAADSSVFPSAPGINPSFTIMALSRHAAQGMLR
ncbi:MAG: GMC family oxidoreductase [Deltaproteobacteria bacterium]|nr:GMC family oxidoreductase [Deltaproteobacteria bacterium]